MRDIKMIGSYTAKCQGKPKPRLSNRNEPAAVWQGTGYLKVIIFVAETYCST